MRVSPVLGPRFIWVAQCQRYSSLSRVPTVQDGYDTINIQRFRDLAFNVNRPLIMKHHDSSTSSLPAIEKWFQPQGFSIEDSRRIGLTPYLEHIWAKFPYELVYPQRRFDSSTNSEQEAVNNFCLGLLLSGDPINTALAELIQASLPQDTEVTHLVRFNAPLALLVAAVSINNQKPGAMQQLYIAQAPLNHIPDRLKEDLPTPRIVTETGIGDVYDSSVWLGLEPTYTPWHRDPNPNLFVQLCSSKIIRLLPPSFGEHIYRQVQMRLGQHGNSRIRGAEMMEGPERDMLHDAIWGPEASGDIIEAQVEPGDALFIPKGWWHSVKSSFSDGRLNGSVNWWFR